MMYRFLPLAFVLASLGCDALGDDSAVRAFYPTVQQGAPLSALIAAGEKAQSYDIEYAVSARGCPGDELLVSRHNDEPSIRVSHPPPDSSEPWRQSYDETGYATREDFLTGLKEIVPKFYACKEFVFTFGRFQGWPNSDSFHVTVDSDGKVLSVSALTRDQRN